MSSSKLSQIISRMVASQVNIFNFSNKGIFAFLQKKKLVNLGKFRNKITKSKSLQLTTCYLFKYSPFVPQY